MWMRLSYIHAHAPLQRKGNDKRQFRIHTIAKILGGMHLGFNGWMDGGLRDRFQEIPKCSDPNVWYLQLGVIRNKRSFGINQKMCLEAE